MRVPEKYGGKLSGGRVQVERLQIVQHIDVAVGDQYHFSLRQLTQRAFAIHIAAHRGHRSDLAQFFQYRGFAHIA